MTFYEAVEVMEKLYENLYFSLDRTRYADGYVAYKACVIIGDDAIAGNGIDWESAIAQLDRNTIIYLLKSMRSKND